jgi:hypothetical protein
VFGPNVRLCDVFDFGEDVPIWARLEGVELVAWSPDGDHHVVVNHLLDHLAFKVPQRSNTSHRASDY